MTIDGRWSELAEAVLSGRPVTREDALAMLRADNGEVLALLDGAYRLRRHYYGNTVKLNLIVNAKSGLCPEDCAYCSQSILSTAPIEKYPLLTRKQLVEGAKAALERKASTYCIVMSGRRPSNREVDEVAAAVREIRNTTNLRICCCLGLVTPEQATKLAEAGVHRYNHNLNTSFTRYGEICTTHTYEDRVETIEHTRSARLSPCSGAIFGMGETDVERVDIAFALRELDVDSIPCNFLTPIEGTPLAGHHELTPYECLKILAMMRFVNPSKEIRIAGGREHHLRSLQPLGLYAANSIFVGDYLTTPGQAAEADWQMIEDLGFEIEHVQ
ncbi:biotin synthase BioB [Alicyclobacillus kakegawensis]|uniref:biotin synthase BioB n=1 Tax=Alicyclobacillus kakegawensis TaxID=392012 RepID=UPI00083238E2|nr:biotin synthase BioB [Alicyclobacillus kakegawensis]